MSRFQCSVCRAAFETEAAREAHSPCPFSLDDDDDKEREREALKTQSVKLGRYQHFEGRFYEVIGCAKHSETLENMVVYRALYENQMLWVRPYSMFFGSVFVETGDEELIKKVPRFLFVKE